MAYKNPEDQKRAARAHYEANKELYKLRAREFENRRRKNVGAYLKALKEGSPCQDCGVSYPSYVMQFDHRQGTNKLFDVANHSSKGFALDRVKEEAAKCDLVCSNCHAERTHQRRE